MRLHFASSADLLAFPIVITSTIIVLTRFGTDSGLPLIPRDLTATVVDIAHAEDIDVETLIRRNKDTSDNPSSSSFSSEEIVVVYPYYAQNDDELSVLIGDTVCVLERFDDGYCFVEKHGNECESPRQTPFVPAHHLQATTSSRDPVEEKTSPTLTPSHYLVSQRLATTTLPSTSQSSHLSNASATVDVLDDSDIEEPPQYMPNNPGSAPSYLRSSSPTKNPTVVAPSNHIEPVVIHSPKCTLSLTRHKSLNRFGNGTPTTKNHSPCPFAMLSHPSHSRAQNAISASYMIPTRTRPFACARVVSTAHPVSDPFRATTSQRDTLPPTLAHLSKTATNSSKAPR
ncbi:hypothetical protein BJ742DRAFT_559740 [Cladochytrium replicatum]|nr:hypothetical protein BJ742DRAFT_559740 [Cladochytrium replicatum]